MTNSLNYFKQNLAAKKTKQTSKIKAAEFKHILDKKNTKTLTTPNGVVIEFGDKIPLIDGESSI